MQVARGTDTRIANLAARQYGLVTRRQLDEIGLSRAAIGHRLSHGRLHRVHRGVYLVGHSVLPTRAREAAAVLAVGNGAVLSHHSAARLWELPCEGDERAHVTTLGSHRRHPGIHIHRTGRLNAIDVRRRGGLPLTSPARTLLDLAEALAPRPLERAFDEALTMRLVRQAELREMLECSAGRRGAPVIRTLLDRDGAPALTRSQAEERLLALVRAARLSEPELNVRIARHEVDFFWRDAQLVVEVDGFAFHSLRAAFERDRRRDAELQSAGFSVMRVTWRQIVDEPEALVALLARALARPEQRLSSGQCP